MDITPPPSPHEPHAGAVIGASQAGWHGWGAAQGAAPPMHGERNSMNDGRRQLFALPKQLLQPGAAARLPSTRTRHTLRDMIDLFTTGRAGAGTQGVVHDAFQP
ncbi:MAG: hypothetical protein RLZZ111_1003 [Planctomycetota bacterium]|jgi:hypothetical protein